MNENWICYLLRFTLKPSKMSSLAKAVDLGKIDEKTKCLIFGYAHNAEKLFNDAIIAESIIIIIISFYYMFEYFDDKTHCILSEYKCKAVSSGMNKNVYGNVRIDSNETGIHEWKFNIGSMKYSGETIIGIVDTSVMHCGGMFTATGKGYAYGDGSLFIATPDAEDKQYRSRYDVIYDQPEFKIGDTVTMRFNLDTKTLYYHINDSDICVTTIKNIPVGNGIRYKLAVFLGYSDDWIKLISYNKW